MQQGPEQADQDEHEQHAEGKEPVARHAALVPQRPQALDAPGGEELDHARVGGDRWLAKPAGEPLPDCFIFRLGGAKRLLGERVAGPGRQRLVAGLEFVDGGGWGRRLIPGLAKLLDLRLDVRQARFEPLGPARQWIVASEQAHGGSSVEQSQQNNDGDANDNQRPGEGQAQPAELPEAVLLEPGPLGGLRLANGGRGFGLAVEHRPLEAGGVPLHPGVLDGGQRLGQFDAPVLLRPVGFIDAVNLGQRPLQVADGHGELLGGAAAGQLGLLQQADATREVLHYFLAAGGQLGASLARLLNLIAFALEFLLHPLEAGQFLLGLGDAGGQLLPAGRGVGAGIDRLRSECTRLLGGLEIAIHKIRLIEF
ncbi:MAG: hypothetical protein CMD77_09115 [Gammaproteobacteria bacterium]|nr:hypothetical protein [Gammaproteobacteria bacterium]